MENTVSLLLNNNLLNNWTSELNYTIVNNNKTQYNGINGVNEIDGINENFYGCFILILALIAMHILGSLP